MSTKGGKDWERTPPPSQLAGEFPPVHYLSPLKIKILFLYLLDHVIYIPELIKNVCKASNWLEGGVSLTALHPHNK